MPQHVAYHRLVGVERVVAFDARGATAALLAPWVEARPRKDAIVASRPGRLPSKTSTFTHVPWVAGAVWW